MGGGCSGIGLLLSVYQANLFVAVGTCGLVFYVAVSYIPSGSIFNILDWFLCCQLGEVRYLIELCFYGGCCTHLPYMHFVHFSLRED